MHPLIFWISGFGSLGFGLFLCAQGDLPWEKLLEERRRARSASDCFHEMEEVLASGLVLDDGYWDRLRLLPAPWSGLSYDALRKLRESGATLVPTLKRLRELAAAQETALAEAKAKSAQAAAQSAICFALVPLLSFVLYEFLPGIQANPALWWAATGACMLLSAAAALWLYRISERARWGGLRTREQPWILESLCFGERLLALLRAGNSVDLAWLESLRALSGELRESFGADLWSRAPDLHETPRTLAESILGFGQRLRAAVQTSLYEGRGAGERIEALIEGLRIASRTFTERELQLLGTRALKPLFLCVAPSVLALLFTGLGLSFLGAM